VVTEPGKAIRALKWTVEQMEERYRMMASIGVRQLSSFNARVREAKQKGPAARAARADRLRRRERPAEI
jgi:S-DNA-T family DNA segregation ATPase FtsK/SpoIIIE